MSNHTDETQQLVDALIEMGRVIARLIGLLGTGPALRGMLRGCDVTDEEAIDALALFALAGRTDATARRQWSHMDLGELIALARITAVHIDGKGSALGLNNEDREAA